jgi:hypothetical protein
MVLKWVITKLKIQTIKFHELQDHFNLFQLQADPNQQAIQPLDIECVT